MAGNSDLVRGVVQRPTKPENPYYVSPLYRWRYITLLLTTHLFVRSVLCLSVLCLSFFSVYHAGGQARNADPMPVYCWPTVYDTEPTLVQYWFTVSCLTPCRMWASVTDSGPTLTQLLFKTLCRYYSQHEVGLLTRVEWILASTSDAGPTFNIRCCVSVGLHCQTRSPANRRR